MTDKNKRQLTVFFLLVVILGIAVCFIFDSLNQTGSGVAIGVFSAIVGSLSLIYISRIKTISDEEALQNLIQGYIEEGCKIVEDAQVNIYETTRYEARVHYPLFGSATVTGTRTVSDFLVKVTSSSISAEFLLSEALIKHGVDYPTSEDEVRSSAKERLVILFTQGKRIVFNY